MTANKAFTMPESPTKTDSIQVCITTEDSQTKQYMDRHHDNEDSAKLFVKTLVQDDMLHNERKKANMKSKGLRRSHSAAGSDKKRTEVVPRLVLSATGNRAHTCNEDDDLDTHSVNLGSEKPINKRLTTVTDQFMSLFLRRSERMSSRSRIRHETLKNQCSANNMETYVMISRAPISRRTYVCPSEEEMLFLSAEQMQNIFAEWKDRVLIVDCREDSESARMDMSYLNTCSLVDLAEADSLQIERINKTNEFIVLGTNLLKEERMVDGHDSLMQFLKLIVEHFEANSNCTITELKILDCALNDVLYLGSNESIPKVLYSFVYILQDSQFKYSAETVYSTVITDSKTVEKFYRNTSLQTDYYFLSTLKADFIPVIYLIDKAKNTNSCVLLCCSDVESQAMALVAAYIMWAFSHSLEDAQKRMENENLVFKFKPNHKKELLEFEGRLFANVSTDTQASF